MIWILIAVVLFLAVWIYLIMPRTGRERRVYRPRLCPPGAV